MKRYPSVRGAGGRCGRGDGRGWPDHGGRHLCRSADGGDLRRRLHHQRRGGTAGREAVLAWKVDRGRFNGVPLDGLAVVAAVAADGNLGVHEIGGDDANTRAALFLDERATPVQRQALVSMVKALSGRMVGNVVEVSPAPIQFVTDNSDIRVATKNVRLTVRKAIEHTATCGNKKWFSPLSTVNEAEMGTTAENAFSGASLGTKWSDPDKRSAFFGTFSVLTAALAGPPQRRRTGAALPHWPAAQPPRPTVVFFVHLITHGRRAQPRSGSRYFR